MAVAVTGAGNLAGNPAADLTVTGLTVTTGNTVSIARSWGGESAGVRSAQSAQVAGATMAFSDAECPFGVPVVYSVVEYDSTGAVIDQAQSAAVTLGVTVPWISDPLAPGVAYAARLHGDALSSLSYQRPGGASGVIGSSRPVGIVGTRLVAGQVQLDLLCRSVVERDAVLAVLLTADPVCLRVPATVPYSMLPALAYVTAQQVVQLPGTLQFGGQDTRIGWTGDLVRAPSIPVVVPIRTYGDLPNEAATYGGLASLYGSYLAVQRGY